MKSITIAPYSIRVKERQSRQGYLPFFKVNSDSMSFTEYIKKMLDNIYQQHTNDQDSNRVFQIRNIEFENNIISGILEVGDYGYTSRLYDTEKLETSYNKSKEEANLIPFYFMFDLDNKEEIGYLLLQRFGNEGVKSQLNSYLKQDFYNFFPEHTMKIEPIVMGESAKEFLAKTDVVQLSFINNSLPEDKADILNLDKNFLEDMQAEYIIRTKRNKKIPGNIALEKILKSKKDNFFELNSLKCNKVKVKIKHNGKIRMIDIENPDKLRSYFDVTNSIKWGLDGHPEESSIKKEMLDILNELKLRDHNLYE